MQTTVGQQVDVVGRIWQGCKAAYTYKLFDDAVPSLFEVQRLATDFAQVTDFRVRRSENSVNYVSDSETVFTTRHLVAKDWSRKGSQRIYEQCTEGTA